MIFTETKLKGAFLIDVNFIEDERGFFGRSYCSEEFLKHGITTPVLQTNLSHNKEKGTLRGMHMQIAPYLESKLVRCTSGAIYDVIIDMREESETYKQWIGAELTGENYRMLYVPEGFAHGFITLEDHTNVMYQVSQYYSPTAERCFRWDDPEFAIKWPLTPRIISKKDNAHALFENTTVI
jgi:dTDP-4-dehydrorhamnose 3,5-epimerase